MQREGYCPSCLSRLTPAPNNTKVTDFTCDCREVFELKSKHGGHGKSVICGEYRTMLKMIEADKSPHFFLLGYQSAAVRNLLVIPSFAVTTSCITPRKPLSATARRAGWQGCSLEMERIPVSCQIPVVVDKMPRPEQAVQKQWHAVRHLFHAASPEGKSWLSDVLCIVEKMPSTFTLADLYEHTDALQRAHPSNNHIEAKIRQQLQVLRDRGCIQFHGGGSYSKI